MRRLSRQLRPADFTRGRLAAGLCAGYLVLVLAAGVFTIDDAATVETVGVSFAGLPLLVLTAPLSLLVMPALSMGVALLFPNGAEVASIAINVVGFFVLALVQAYLGWLILRGPRHAGEARPAEVPESA